MGSQDNAHDVITISARLRPDQLAGLNRLSERRRLARSVLVRQAIDLFLAENISDIDSREIDKVA